jgi:hypothetical protein
MSTAMRASSKLSFPHFPSQFAEATVPQIAIFTDHSLRDVEAILDAHYLGRDIQLVEAAVLKIEQKSSPALG